MTQENTRYDVVMTCSTGEEWQVRVSAYSPIHALGIVLRRKLWREAICNSPYTYKFRVTYVYA